MVNYKKIKKNDNVEILAGKDKGKTGTIIEVDRNKGKVLVDGINLVKKTMRKSQENPNGGIKDIEAFIDISNVAVVCSKCKKATRVGFKVTEDKKVRVCKSCNAEIE